MSQKPAASVIIPCYNEEGNIPSCVEKIRKLNVPFEIVIVNDGSQDATQKVAQELSLKDPRIRLVNFEKNRGKTQAIKEGIAQATEDLVMIQDADASVDPSELLLFYEELQKNPDQFLMGTRFVYPMEKNAMPLKNHISNRLTARLFSWFLKQKVTDTLCGTKAFKKSMPIDFTDCRWPDFDLIIAAKQNGLPIKEIAVKYLARQAGSSKMSLYPDVWHLIRRMWQMVFTK